MKKLVFEYPQPSDLDKNEKNNSVSTGTFLPSESPKYIPPRVILQKKGDGDDGDCGNKDGNDSGDNGDNGGDNGGDNADDGDDSGNKGGNEARTELNFF